MVAARRRQCRPLALCCSPAAILEPRRAGAGLYEECWRITFRRKYWGGGQCEKQSPLLQGNGYPGGVKADYFGAFAAGGEPLEQKGAVDLGERAYLPVRDLVNSLSCVRAIVPIVVWTSCGGVEHVIEWRAKPRRKPTRRPAEF